MAHAHDRTYLASLAWGDPDKKDPLHDLGCRYVQQRLHAPAPGDVLTPILEFPINKGSGQYKTTIGFVDVMVRNANSWLFVEVKIKPVTLGDALRQIQLYASYLTTSHSQYKPNCAQWIFAAAFDMSAAFEEGLREHEITPMKLGKGFHEFVEQTRTSNQPGTAQEI